MISHEIKEACEGASAITFLYGYAQFPNGQKLHFEQGKELSVKRTPNGRCTYAKFKYSDGSIIEFSWSESLGSKINARSS